MIGREGLVSSRQFGRTHVGELPGVHMRGQTQGPRGAQQLFSFGQREGDVFAERVDRVHQAGAGERFEPRAACLRDEPGTVCVIFLR